MNWLSRIITVILSTLILVLPIFKAEPTNAAEPERSTLTPGLVMAVGDSIVQGVGTSDPDRLSWPVRVGAVRAGASGGCVVMACFGQRSMVAQFEDSVLAARPEAVVLALGINDIAAGATPSQVVDGLASLAYRARLTGARVYVQTLIPVGPARWNWELDRQAVNNMIRARFPHVIDMDPMLVHPKRGTLRWCFDSGDNLHPNSHGYRMMAAMVRDALLHS